MRKRNRLESDQAVAKMQQRGLKVTPVSSEVQAEWRKAVEQRYGHFRGSRIPADLFDEVMSHLRQFRSGSRQLAAGAR